MKNDLPHFSHDNDARNHPKMKALLAQFGPAGYGRFWMLNEIIAQSENATLDISKKIYKLALAQELGFTLSDLLDFLAFLSDPEIDLIIFENDKIMTDRTQEDLSRAMKARESAKTRRERKTPASYDEHETSPDESKTSYDETHRAEQSREEKNIYSKQASLSQSPCAREEQEPCQESACLPAVIDLKRLLKEAPFPAAYDQETLIAFSKRLEEHKLDSGFIAFAIEKARSAKKPAGLLKIGILTYDEWIDEYLWAKGPSINYPPPSPPEPIDRETAEQNAKKARACLESLGITLPSKAVKVS